MYMSGVRTGITKITLVLRITEPLGHRLLEATVLYVAVRGTTIHCTVAVRVAMGAIQMPVTTPTVFVWFELGSLPVLFLHSGFMMGVCRAKPLLAHKMIKSKTIHRYM